MKEKYLPDRKYRVFTTVTRTKEMSGSEVDKYIKDYEDKYGTALYYFAQEIKQKRVISYIWKKGRKLKEGYNDFAKKHGLDLYTECIGLPPRTVILFKDTDGEESLEMKTLFQQEAIKRGVLFSGAHNICYSHTDEDIENTLHAYDEALEILARAIKGKDIKSYIEGEIIQPVFRKP